MAGIADATAATLTVELGGTTYELSPLAFRDIGYLEQWMRDALVQSGREAIKDATLRKDDKVLILDRAYKAAESVSLMGDNGEGSGFMRTAELAVRFLWLSLRKAQPRLTLEQADKLLDFRSQEKVQELMDKVSRISGMTDDKDGADGADGKS